jgi:polyhydroxyalkanoate synthesis regulator phasin
MGLWHTDYHSELRTQLTRREIMDLKGDSQRLTERLEELKRAVICLQEELVDLLEVLNLGDVFTAKAVAAQMLNTIKAIPELKGEQKIQLPENLEELLKFQPVALKSLAQMLHELLGAIRVSDLEVAQGIAKQLEGFIKEEPFLDFTED